VPFLRFSRDKRGYEHIYLVHTPNRRGKPSRPRVLYWYRTPPGIRVGRPPFDDEVRRRLEAQNPEVVFDWPTIIATPIPPPAENEQWRERRRAERAAKQSQRAEEDAVARSDQDATGGSPDVSQPDESPAAAAIPFESLPEVRNEHETALAGTEPRAIVDVDRPAEAGSGSSEPGIALTPLADGSSDVVARRRRRRGGRRRHGRRQPGDITNQGVAAAGNPVVPTYPETGSSETMTDSDITESVESNDE
jgi:hypothetical protein